MVLVLIIARIDYEIVSFLKFSPPQYVFQLPSDHFRRKDKIENVWDPFGNTRTFFP